MRISVITIGDELLIGQVVDTNSSVMAKLLYPLGKNIYRKFTVADKEEEIKYAMQEAGKCSEIVLITGGLGPTKDDITKKAMAAYFNVPLVYKEEAFRHIEKIFIPRNIIINEAQKTQCYVPEGAELLDNKMGTALGIKFKSNNCIWISMPGVPFEMEYIMQHSVIPMIAEMESSHKLIHHTIHFCGMGETMIAERLEPLIENMKNEISLAYLPSLGIVKLRISNTLHSKKDSLEKALEIIKLEFKNSIFGYGETDLSTEIGRILRSRKLKIGTAESCTGGSIANKIVSSPGASDYFEGSIIAYANEVKSKSLHVPEDILLSFGAVSEECLKQMILGGNQHLGTDLILASTGIAGPDGGTPDKPVGTVWLGVGNAKSMKTKQMRFFRDRSRNIEASTIWSLIMLWEYLHETSI